MHAPGLPKDDSFLSRRWGLVLAAVFLLTLLTRLAALKFFAEPPRNDLIWNEAVGWNLARGLGFTVSQAPPYVPGIFRTPGYPAFIAVVYLLFGHHFMAVFVAQAVLDALAAVMLACLGWLLVDRRAGALAGLFYSLYPYPAFFCGTFYQETLLSFSIQGVLLLTALACRRERPAWWLAVGLAMGWAVMVKAFVVLFVGVPLGAAWLRHGRDRAFFLAAGGVLAGIALFLVPWQVRNFAAYGMLTPPATGGTGSNLVYLHDELELGEAGMRARIDNPPPGRPWAGRIPYDVDGAFQIREQQALVKEYLPEILAKWPRYLVVMAEHAPRLWITRMLTWKSSLASLAGTLVSYGLLLPGLAAMWILRRRWRELYLPYAAVIGFTLMYVPYTAEARYTLPARASMLLLIAAGAVYLWDRRRGKGQE